MERRSILSGGLAAALAARRGLHAAADRPNIVFAIADDQSWLHTSGAGDAVVKTPAIDRVAGEGVRFTHAFCCSPSCTPSRAAILSGQDVWRLRESGNLWSTLSKDIEVYPSLLESADYRIGLTGKGWGPGDFKPGGWTRNPAGPATASFDEFHRSVPKGQPFCYWYGGRDPHRAYTPGQGLAAGLKLDDVKVPAWLPDSREVRSDILDYYFAVQRFDSEVGRILSTIEKAGQLENTLFVTASDNGMPFPRAKTNLYDSGTRMPLAMRWPARFKGGRVVDDFVSFADLAPTFLEAAGLKPRPAMTGRSFLNVLLSGKSGRVDRSRDAVWTARERHTVQRTGAVGYPMRAIRTYDHLYIRNFAPDRWPAGDPPDCGDIDDGPAKQFVIANRETPAVARFYEMACGKRPAEELYDLRKDPDQQVNVAQQSAYAETRKRLSARMERRLKETGDPRVTGGEVIWDTTPYYGTPRPLPGRGA
jgi:N-sulfoglucosamine sulfohydrolase